MEQLTSSLVILPATEILKPNFFVGESSSANPQEEIRSLDGLGACGEQAWEENLQDGRARAGLLGPDFPSLPGGPTAHSLSSVRAAGKTTWLWFPKKVPLSVASIHLGFTARAVEVRRFGAEARRLSPANPRFVDSRSFASVVMGSPRDRAGGMNRNLDRKELWFGGAPGPDGGGSKGGAELSRFGGKKESP
ncbi:hypothetical protein GUJ93_ZPchr0014g47567 [Zizania palustris]|uniref:Uncharacterized protein n=1 Tax=Zizania palustris TaxID=103762 RepID=A0A8J5TKT8_ZIZPA|nr:hypothetical protein GUJ93_ZPchr0014g47567 [Zizania palustris]